MVHFSERPLFWRVGWHIPPVRKLLDYCIGLEATLETIADCAERTLGLHIEQERREIIYRMELKTLMKLAREQLSNEPRR